MGLVICSAIAGGSFAYGWHSVRPSPQTIPPKENVDTSVPEASVNNSELQPLEDVPALVDTPQLAAVQPLSPQLSENGEVMLTLDEAQLNQLLSQAILSQEHTAQLLVNAHSWETQLSRDRIETGAVMNLADLPLEGLPPEFQAGLTQLKNAAPMLMNRDIYVGVVAQPQVRDGRLTLAQDLNFKLGQFTLPLTEVATSMGLSIEDIEQQINAVLAQQAIILNSVEILDQQLVITGVR